LFDEQAPPAPEASVEVPSRLQARHWAEPQQYPSELMKMWPISNNGEFVVEV
jgi:hypothetical protein